MSASKNRESSIGPGQEIVATCREPGQEIRTTDQKLQSSSEPKDKEPVYTIIGEPVFPAEEITAITIVVNNPSIPSGGLRNDEEDLEGGTHSQQRRHFTPVGWTLVGVLVALVGILVAMLVIPWFETSATVTIIPLTKPVTTTLTAHLVAGPADLSRQQAQGRQLAALSMSQSKTIPTTGSSSQAAQVAQGVITFYNALPTAQTILAGTLIIGQDGTQVTTDTAVTIPAGQFANNGQVQVSAHATEPGPAGNISALDIHGPCCRTDVLAQNAAPFTGGQNARVYQSVSTQDITGASAALEATLLQEVTVAYQAELVDGESLVTPVACVSQVKADHPAGAEAVRVTISVTEACQGSAYNTVQMRVLVLQVLNEQGQFGAYQISGSSLRIQITSGSTQEENVQIQVHATLSYQWNQQQLRALAALIAGKSEAAAREMLLRQLGVSMVIFSVSGRETGTLPDDPGRIQITTVSAHPGY